MKYNWFICWIGPVTAIITAVTVSCNTSKSEPDQKPLFTILNSRQTKIDFINQVEYTEEFNTYTYRNFYNGAGVGLGDFNNDGLTDIYFCANQIGNRLYLNRGGFVFDDITQSAGVACTGSWSTGVTIADINGDGWQDIYVCKSGKPTGIKHPNELFINNGDLTFTERAEEYGLSNFGLSNHASFFDYDRDGDLDCYLINNSFQSVTGFDMKPGEREIPDTMGANKLFRNDDGHFTDVTRNTGIYSSKIGFGLGVSAGDINMDGWPDIYVSNDFFERDYLYINNRDGSFSETLVESVPEISQGAMGADLADINNDGWPEIFATEMTAEDNARLKTKVLFDTWDTYQLKLTSGYHHQFARNVLQLNIKNGSFSEIGRYSGVSTTDWSWGALIMDLDNDGWKDIFVANGIYKDLLDRDFLDIYSNPSIMRSMIETEESAILRLIELIPSVRIPNYAFHNNRDLTFTNFSEQWGLSTPSYSNGSAYGDLDNDGDLDLVINNVNMPPFIFRNEAAGRMNSNYISIKFKGKGFNTSAIGAKATIWYNGQINYQELIPARGFQSSVDSRLHFGLGSAGAADSLKIEWPDGKLTLLKNIPSNQFITIAENESSDKKPDENKWVAPALFKKSEKIPGLDFRHAENDFVDFDRDRLLFQMLSNEGPHIATGDVNGDGFEDLYICGAKDSQGALFVQDQKGHFRKTNEKLFDSDKISEDTDCVFFDADNDGDLDLYVASGGNEFPESSSALSDRLYINNGKGVFSRSDQVLPAGLYESTSCVQPADFDGDGDIDLFTGIRLHPFSYGLPANGYLLENNGKGIFSNITGSRAQELTGIGMIKDMEWADIDNDNDPDMIIAGDWMPVKVFINENGFFKDESERFGLSNTEGWWNVITAKDLNNDGFIDFVLGNHGLNSFFKASAEKPVTMFVNDFDMNGSIEQIICTFNGDTLFPLVMRDDLLKQIPSLATKYKRYVNYKNQTMQDIFAADVLNRSIVLKAVIMESCIMMNNKGRSFSLIPLPAEAQLSPVYAIAADDFDKDGVPDIVLGGNQYRAKPQTGIYGAGYGLLLKGDKNENWHAVPPDISGLFERGEIRDFKLIKSGVIRIFVVAKNNDNLQFYEF